MQLFYVHVCMTVDIFVHMLIISNNWGKIDKVTSSSTITSTTPARTDVISPSDKEKVQKVLAH